MAFTRVNGETGTRGDTKGVIVLEYEGKGWLREVGPRGVALDAVRTHIAAEVDTRTEVIMSTVSADPWFPLPDRAPEGLGLTVAEGTADVTRYYAERSDGYVVLASNQLKQLVADWYVFNESAATLRQTGPIGDVEGVDVEFVVNSAVLFPTAPDGIRGEIAVTRYPFADVIQGRVTARAAGPDRSRTSRSRNSSNQCCSTTCSTVSPPATCGHSSPTTTPLPCASTAPLRTEALRVPRRRDVGRRTPVDCSPT